MSAHFLDDELPPVPRRLAQPNWDALGRELVRLRGKARQERRVFGCVSAKTMAALDEALARAEAAVVIDEAKVGIGS